MNTVSVISFSLLIIMIVMQHGTRCDVCGCWRLFSPDWWRHCVFIVTRRHDWFWRRVTSWQRRYLLSYCAHCSISVVTLVCDSVMDVYCINVIWCLIWQSSMSFTVNIFYEAKRPSLSSPRFLCLILSTFIVVQHLIQLLSYLHPTGPDHLSLQSWFDKSYKTMVCAMTFNSPAAAGDGCGGGR